MTLNQFFEELKNNRDKEFRVCPEIRIFKGIDDYCPVTYICKIKTDRSFSVFGWDYAAKEINLKKEVARKLIYAADKKLKTPYIKRLRARLLKALKLERN